MTYPPGTCMYDFLAEMLKKAPISRDFIWVSLCRQDLLTHCSCDCTQFPVPFISPKIGLISGGSMTQPSNHKFDQPQPKII